MPIPYTVSCSECGSSMEVVNRTMDDEGDVFIEVAPCETCCEDAAEAAKKETTP